MEVKLFLDVDYWDIFKRECLKNRGTSGPELCPHCCKGHHWSNEYRSKQAAKGRPLYPPGNGEVGPLWGPQARVYRALNNPAITPTPIWLVPQANPFMSKTLSEVPQEVQDCTSAHPPEQY